MFAVATAYFLAQTVFQLVFSHISHGVGRKYAYLSGVGFYIIGSIIAATSPRARQLVAARAVQGMGAAGMFTMSAIVIVDIMQPRQRAAWSAISQAFGALGNICGPLFAGLLFKKFGWVGLVSYVPWQQPLLSFTQTVLLTHALAFGVCHADNHRVLPVFGPARTFASMADWKKANSPSAETM